MSAATGYMINAHGFELLHTNAVKLQPNEHVIMLCNWGCPLTVKNLFNDFIYKHVSYAKDADDLYGMLLDTGSVAKKYKPLNFIKNIFCIYSDHVPEIRFMFDDPTFRSGVYQLPITTSQRVSGLYLSNPYAPVNITSRYMIPDNGTLLSDIIVKLREQSPNGFTLVTFTCRDFISALPEPKKLRNFGAGATR